MTSACCLQWGPDAAWWYRSVARALSYQILLIIWAILSVISPSPANTRHNVASSTTSHLPSLSVITMCRQTKWESACHVMFVLVFVGYELCTPIMSLPALLKLRNPFVIVGCLHWGTCPGVQVSETGQDIVSVVMLGQHHPTISTWHRHLVGDFNDSSRLFGGLCII